MSEKIVSQLYPHVGRIVLFAAFEEADAECEPNYQQIIFTPDAEAAFRLACSREECSGGGFDFARIIDEMVKTGESRAHGKLACAGIVDSGSCGLKAEYRIIID
jgi:hypothetical protein